MATTAATSATFLAGKHHTLSPATTTATAMAALNEPAKRRYLAKMVCLHFSGLSPLWLGFTWTLWCIQVMTLSSPNEHPNALLSKCCHCFHQIKIMFCKIKTVEASSTLQFGTYLLYIIICATFLLAYKTFCSYLWMVCTHSATTCSRFRDEVHETALLFDLFTTLQVLPLTELDHSITHFNIFHSCKLIVRSYVSICGNKL